MRTGAVLDLKIQKGKILARVQGTRKTLYKVEIRISPLSEEKCQMIIQKCGKKLENIEALMAGNFPEEMQECCLEYYRKKEKKCLLLWHRHFPFFGNLFMG